MASTPYVTTSTLTTVLAPAPIVGESASDTVGFYGNTGVAQTNAAITNTGFNTLPSTVLSGLTATTPYGFDTLADAQALVNQVKALTAALVAVGLIVS